MQPIAGASKAIRAFLLQDVIASVSLSHDPGCRCLTCKAAHGDVQAHAQLLSDLAAGKTRLKL